MDCQACVSDLSELCNVSAILDCIESKPSPSCFQLGQEGLLVLTSAKATGTASQPLGKYDPALLSQILARASVSSSSLMGIAGTHARQVFSALAHMHCGKTCDTVKTFHRLTHTASGIELPINIHATLGSDKTVRFERIDCGQMFADEDYVLPVNDLTAQEAVLVLLRLVSCLEFETAPKLGGGVQAQVCEKSRVMLAMASALLGVDKELENVLLQGMTQQDAERNRNKFVVLVYAGWLNQTLCTKSSNSGGVQVWTTSQTGSPDAFLDKLLQGKALVMARQNVDGHTLLRVSAPTTAAASKLNTPALALNLDALFFANGSGGGGEGGKQLKPEFKTTLVAGTLQAELATLGELHSTQTQFWIRCGTLHYNNRALLLGELQDVGALALIKTCRTLPVCEASFQELACNIASMVPGAQDEFDNKESAMRVLDAFQVKNSCFGTTNVYFTDNGGLNALVWAMRATPKSDFVQTLTSGVCGAGLARLRERFGAASLSPSRLCERSALPETGLDSARRRTRMSRKLELVKLQVGLETSLPKARCKLYTLVRTMILFRSVFKQDYLVLHRGQVRAVGGNNQTHCALTKNKRSGAICLLSFTNKADAIFNQRCAIGTWSNVVDYVRVSDLSIELQFDRDASAPLVMHFNSEQCNQQWSFAIEQNLALPAKQKADHPMLAPSARAAGGVMARRPSISRNLLGDTVNELVHTERTYIADLGNFLAWFRDPMLAQLDSFGIARHEFDAIFNNIIQIKVFHEALLAAAGTSFCSPAQTCEAFALAFKERQIFFHRIYALYTDRHSSALETYMTCLKRSKRFAKFIQQTVNAHQQQDVASFLIKPIQRMVKYPLFFRQMADWMNREDSMATPALRAVMEETLEISKHITKQVTLHDASKELRGMELMLQSDFQDMPAGITLCEPGRSFVDEFNCRLLCTILPDASEVRSKKSSKSWHLFVFNDVVMFAKPSSAAPTLTTAAKATKATYKYRGWFEFTDLRFSLPIQDSTNSTLEIVFTPPQQHQPQEEVAVDEGEDDANWTENDGDEHNRTRAAASSVSSFKSISSTTSSRYASMKKKSASFIRRRISSSFSSKRAPPPPAVAAASSQTFILAFDTEEIRNQAFAVLNRTHEALRALRLQRSTSLSSSSASSWKSSIKA